MHEAGTSEVYICASGVLQDGGKGLRFPVTVGNMDLSAFVVRHNGKAYAYLNRCAHIPIELDWEEGTFFESSGLYLMCSTHGALYVPESGYCVGGPCKGRHLHPIALIERAQQLFWQPDDYVRPARS